MFDLCEERRNRKQTCPIDGVVKYVLKSTIYLEALGRHGINIGYVVGPVPDSRWPRF